MEQRVARRYRLALLVILFATAALRTANLEQSPPGLQQDEAANGWNAWCLLKTGMDQVGVRWPVFYSRSTGSNNSTLYLYLLLPFQALGGLNVTTTRLPSAVGGVLTVALIYYVATRLFDRRTGLVAAVLLTFNPWHIHLSRIGTEGGIAPLLVIAPLAALLWAKLPFDDADSRRPRPFLAGLGGVLTGVVCYGYWAVRLFVPLFYSVAVIVGAKAWLQLVRSRRGAAAVVAAAAGTALTFGPLLWTHMTDEGINRRGQSQLLWNDPELETSVSAAVLTRYVRHFGMDFLFLRGDLEDLVKLPTQGQFHWYMLPLFVAGMVAVLRRVRSSRAARLLLAAILTYPAGDVLGGHVIEGGMHALRSAVGLPGWILLASLGATSVWAWAQKARPRVRWILAGSMIVLAAALNLRYLHVFFGAYNRVPAVYHVYQTDLKEACKLLGPELQELDAVFFTTNRLHLPYLPVMVHLDYDPQQWFRDEREITTPGEFDWYTRIGKLYFVYSRSADAALRRLRDNGRRDRVAFVARPGELDQLGTPKHSVTRPDGTVVLHIYVVPI